VRPSSASRSASDVSGGGDEPPAEPRADHVAVVFRAQRRPLVGAGGQPAQRIGVGSKDARNPRVVRRLAVDCCTRRREQRRSLVGRIGARLAATADQRAMSTLWREHVQVRTTQLARVRELHQVPVTPAVARCSKSATPIRGVIQRWTVISCPNFDGAVHTLRERSTVLVALCCQLWQPAIVRGNGLRR